jgi:hypothetical protein
MLPLNWFAKCLVIAFIPRRYVQDIFADKISDKAPLDKYLELEQFTYYMLSTWIDDHATFHMDIISKIVILELNNEYNECYKNMVEKSCI